MCFSLLGLLYLTLGGAAARSTKQFQDFFPVAKGLLPSITNASCSLQLTTYLNKSAEDQPPGKRSVAVDLMNCILENTPEFNKFEFAITGLLLGLLPAGLALLGPSLADLSLLALAVRFWRCCSPPDPPSPNPLGETTGAWLSRSKKLEDTPSTPPEAPMAAAWLLHRCKDGLDTLEVAFGIVEYCLALGAFGCTIYQIYQLTFKAVSLAAVTLPGFDECPLSLGFHRAYRCVDLHCHSNE